MRSLFSDYLSVVSSRGRAYGLVVLASLSGLLEVAALTMLIPLLNPEAILAPGSRLAGLTERVGVSTTRELVYIALLGFVVLGLGSALVKGLADTGVLRLRIRLERDMRAQMSDALLTMEWTSFHSMRLGDIAKSVISEGNQASLGLQVLLQATGHLAVGVLFLLTALVLAPLLTIMTLAFGATLGLVYRAANKRMDAASQHLSDATSSIGEETEAVFGSLKYIRTTGEAQAAAVRLHGLYEDFADRSLRAHVLVPKVRMLFEGSGLAFVAAVLAFSAFANGTPAASALAFVALFYRLAPRLHSVQEQYMLARAHRPWLLTWRERLALATSHADRANGVVEPSLNSELILNGVGLHYAGAPTPAVDRVTVRFESGSCTAIVGESGSGKSTVLDLVSGLLAPTYGTVTVDGLELERADRALWQRKIGVVMQDNPIYHASIASNISWLDDQPDALRIRDAAASANALTFIDELAAGMETVVGERGGRLSGGQRQRLALARALYRQPWLLLLDEATSALDSESEASVLTALTQLKGKQTMVLVAHRLATTQIADTILVMDRGRIVQTGTFAELLQESSGRFATLAAAQGLVPVA